jgi:hypothetical protein
MNHRVTRQWTFQQGTTSQNFFWLVCKNRNALGGQLAVVIEMGIPVS